MATTSPDLALHAVAAIEQAGVRFAILHGEEELLRGDVASDVDVVGDRPVRDLVHAVAGSWADIGLYPVVVWPYDVGGTGSVFLATSDARQGVQLDVLHDLDGRGRYGARSGLLLNAARSGRRFPVVAPAERFAYLLAKRISKGQTSDIERTIESHGQEHTVAPALDVLRPQMANVVSSFLWDGSTPRRPSVHDLRTLIGRLRHPVGAWIEVGGESAERMASELATRFGGFLPHAVCVPAPGFGSWATTVAPIRWRAGIVSSHGVRHGMAPGPDVSIWDAESADDACREAVSSLALRNWPNELLS